ncbi:hypothetical protein ABIE44_002380 [Marmoricola sp. OAE513]|uniref:SGNH/GDSL hydrolase family protein n=1 Tax=Marmoricola sp. OAE513 TaxID=2817894 RepID=UPI001AEB71EB
MTRTRHLVRGAALTIGFSLLAACGSGGFGSAEPSALPTLKVQKYVALGDGFASAPYLGADTSKSLKCLRSKENYPHLVSTGVSASVLVDATCVGATTKALTSASKAPGSKKELRPQFDAVASDTDLITIGIGIEDGNLLQDMFRICTAEPCGDDVLAPTILRATTAYGTSLTTALRTLQDVAPRAKIIVVGYPQLMPKTGLCDALPDMTDVQLNYAATVLDKINTLLRSAASQTGSTFIDVAELSADHTACSDVPWVNSFRTKPGKQQAFHPVEAEQQAVADAILDVVRSTSQAR